MSVELEGDISTSTNSFIRNERTVAEEEFEQQIRVKKETFQNRDDLKIIMSPLRVVISVVLKRWKINSGRSRVKQGVPSDPLLFNSNSDHEPILSARSRSTTGSSSDNFARERLLSKKKPLKDSSTDNNIAAGWTNVHPKDLWQTQTANVQPAHDYELANAWSNMLQAGLDGRMAIRTHGVSDRFVYWSAV